MAILHREVVERKKCLAEDGFLAAIRLCILRPVPEAQQLATYAGWRVLDLCSICGKRIAVIAPVPSCLC